MLPCRIRAGSALLLLCFCCADPSSTHDADPGACPADGSGGAQCKKLQPADPSIDANFSDGASGPKEKLGPRSIPPERLALLAVMFLSIVCWLGFTVKCACDGSLPARLALWGLLPEAFAAISPRCLAHLLRLKIPNQTPVILLQNSVTDEGAVQLADAIRDYGVQSGMQAVEIPHNLEMSCDGLRFIVAAILGKGQEIEALDLSHNEQLGDGLAEVLRPLLESRKSTVKELKIAGCNLTTNGLLSFLAYAEKSKITLLDLSFTELGQPEAIMEKIADVPMLEELNLSYCNLTVTDVRVLAEQLPYTSIKSLDLSGNAQLGSEGLKALSEHLAGSLIEELGLEGLGLTADCEGMSKLGAAWAKRPFQRIKLANNFMSQEEVRSFVTTLRMIHD